MGVMYSASFDNVTVAAVQDLLQVATSTAVGARSATIHEIQLSSNATTDERLRIIFHSGTTNGSGGSTPTAVPLHPGQAAAQAVIEANNTTQATNGTTFQSWEWSVLVPFHYLPTPEARIIVATNDLFHVSLETAPTSSVMSGFIVWEEM